MPFPKSLPSASLRAAAISIAFLVSAHSPAQNVSLAATEPATASPVSSSPLNLVIASASGVSSSRDDLPLAPQPEPQAPQHPVKVIAPAELDTAGAEIPLDRRQPQRILGFMPNFRSVSSGARPHPPGWKYNFTIATRQSFDYSSFIFLGITSLSAEGINSHPVLGKGVEGFYSYTWRGFLDKTDGTYLGAWLLPSLLHEDTRYYAMGKRRSVPTRVLYVISRQAVTRTYGGSQTPNIAGLGGKVLTQLVSREYYPSGATSFSVLATKFGYSAMRDVVFTSIREFYPDIAAHYIRKHREKVARLADKDVAAAAAPSIQP